MSLSPTDKGGRGFEPARERSVQPSYVQGGALIVAGYVALFCGPAIGLLYVTQVIKNDLGPLLTVCALVFGPALGGVLIRIGKRRKSRDARDILQSDGRPPVLYLRSFGADERAAQDAGTAVSIRGVQVSVTTTEEEQIARAVRRAGPMVAIGRPNEALPLLGAARMYVADEQWQDQVLKMMDLSCLVLMRAGKTEGFWWELETAVKKLRPEKVVLLVPFSKGNYTAFAERANQLLPKPLPLDAGEMKHMVGSLKAWIWFESDWTPHLEKVTGGHAAERLSPVAKLIRHIVEPVFVRIGQPHLALRSSIWRRVVAGSVDLALIALVDWVVMLLSGQPWDSTVPAMTAGVFGLAYFVLLDLPGLGGTVGKRWLKLRVVDESGEEPTMTRALLRSLAKCLLPLTVGPACGIYVLASALVVPGASLLRRTPHDMLTRTFVVGPSSGQS